jgi:murein DD-endopeptidase MepM/ murein hydrolase activator NlpD
LHVVGRIGAAAFERDYVIDDIARPAINELYKRARARAFIARPGIDLSAPYVSPVHATAAGTVTYAGNRSDYGKVVEIDHGNGIATLYAHLHRYIVSVGQRVAEHEQIGFLGSSGRSSGPHVHYEVLVNNEPQDPEKFIGLARVIPAAER